MNYYKVTVGERGNKNISVYWDDLVHIYNVRSMHGKTGREVAADAWLALDWLALNGHAAYNGRHQAARWPDGVKTLPGGNVIPLDHGERLDVMTVLLRGIMKMGHANYTGVFKVELIEV